MAVRALNKHVVVVVLPGDMVQVVYLRMLRVAPTTSVTNRVSCPQATIVPLLAVFMVQMHLCHGLALLLVGGSDLVDLVKGWGVHRGEAMQCVGIGFQGIAAAVCRLHGPTLKGLKEPQLISAKELLGGLLVCARNTRLVETAHGYRPRPTARCDHDLSGAIVFEDPALPFPFQESQPAQLCLQVRGWETNSARRSGQRTTAVHLPDCDLDSRVRMKTLFGARGLVYTNANPLRWRGRTLALLWVRSRLPLGWRTRRIRVPPVRWTVVS